VSELSKEDVQKIDTELAFPFGCVVLRCDDDTVTIQVQRTKPRRYDLMIYVNGWFKGTYLKPDTKENRFYRPVKAKCYKPAERAKIIRAFGKRQGARLFPKLDETFTYWMPSWLAPGPMLRHFARVSNSVALVSVGTAISVSVEFDKMELPHD
jgi:hypothetical protein